VEALEDGKHNDAGADHDAEPDCQRHLKILKREDQIGFSANLMHDEVSGGLSLVVH
jgi:hypothetical protein